MMELFSRARQFEEKVMLLVCVVCLSNITLTVYMQGIIATYTYHLNTQSLKWKQIHV